MDNGASSYRRFLAGDDRGLADIITEYRDGLVFFLNGFVNDLHTAEDLAEDTFFRLAVKKPRFQGKSSFKTWLYAIGRNEAYQKIRRNKITYAALDEIPEIISEYDWPELQFFKEQQHQTLHRCLSKLKSEYHQVLWLYYFENFSTGEISVLMKKNVHNVETLLYRARKAVKRELEMEGFQYENL